MRILIAGSSGFIGTSLCEDLRAKGHQVDVLQRIKGGSNNKLCCSEHSSCTSGGITWDPPNRRLDFDAIEGYDAFINLAGENIQKRRWISEQKRKILTSRIEATSLLCSSAAKLKKPPKVILNASAIGYYGNRGGELLNESSSHGQGFLAEVCQEWEEATLPAKQAGIRTVNLRFGVVLSPAGGALKKMVLPFKLCLGGPIGSGKQYVSWIVLDDLINIISFLLDHSELSGPVNVVAPNPITNEQLTKALGAALSRPTLFRVPEFFVRLIFGEMGEELLLSSARAVPRKLQDAGYQFVYSKITFALKQLLTKQEKIHE